MTTSQQPFHEDDRRARELFHYFQPENPALLPSCSRSGTSCPPSSKASPNLVLTALTQLAALKLGVQRAIISLIDRETLYVVAEASRSLNLGNNDVYGDDGDGLWMGCSHGPVAGTLCEKTISLKPTSESRYPLFVVDDLREHKIYRNIPCVSGPPYFRYYAGTPLTTSNGINIGSLYVIDPRPNLSMPASQKETLGNIADAVMEYLETSRQSLEGQRLTKVLSGLNTFVQGEDNSDSSSSSLYKSPILSDRGSSHTTSARQSPEPEFAIPVPPDFSNSPSLRPTSSGNNVIEASEGLTVDLDSSVPSSDDRVPNQQALTWSTDQAGNQRHPNFQRAAELMRESLDLGQDGGVVIFDSSERHELELQETSDQEKDQQLAKIWAISSKDTRVGETGRVSDSSPATQLDLHFMHRMLRRYPRGGLWYFYHDGTAFSSDDDATSSSSEVDAPNPSPRSQPYLHPRSQGTLREKDLQSLKKYFPNATRIIFAPLWDSFNSQWFGGCFCWSGVETRVFSAHVELGGVFGFGSSLMVEHSRVQNQESDRKKGDFISSISHELRSPLHGILAATGFLYEEVDPEFVRSMLDTIRACGQTLLDTFEQILDFTKINSFEKKRHGTNSRSRSERNHEKSRPRSLHIIKVVDVAAVVEEVVESVYSGQVFTRSMTLGEPDFDNPGENNSVPSTNAEGQVGVFIDIAPHDWKFLLEPGALRRIVMNVFGNALKYTHEGSVSVRLEIQKKVNGSSNQTSADAPGSEVLLLTVSDTGRGISNDYLRSNIFTPFSQEDPLSPGTGLGLSLVRNILRSLDGGIKIKSQMGSGTVVMITLPLARPQQLEQPQVALLSRERLLHGTTDIVQRVKTKLAGKSLSVVSIENVSNQKLSSLHTIGNYLTQWFGMEKRAWNSTATIDFILIDENQLDLLNGISGQPIVLILCRRGPKPRSPGSISKERTHRIIRVPLPCGPYRLARALCDFVESTPNQQTLPSSMSESTLPLTSTTQSATALSDPVYTETTSIVEDSSVAVDKSLIVVKTELHRLNITAIPESDEGIRFLLVEDNAINLALLRKFVTRLKPRILHTAMNGKIAVDKVKAMAESYDYIFMDMSMPVMDGFEATQAIRFIERERSTITPATIIALTGLGASEHIKKAYAAGVNVFLTKPVSFTDIELLINERKTSVPLKN